MNIGEPEARLIAGVVQAMQCLIVALESTQSLNRSALEHVLEARLKAVGDDDLVGVPMAMLWGFLRPQDPPRPVLRLIRDGKQ